MAQLASPLDWLGSSGGKFADPILGVDSHEVHRTWG
jgi:hypothetical protein